MARRRARQGSKQGRRTTSEANSSTVAVAPADTSTVDPSTDTIPNEWHKRSADLNPKYKSQLCKNFMEKGPDGCRFGDKCVFAHGAHELRSAQKDDVPVKARRARGRGNKRRDEPLQHDEPKPRVQFREGQDELLCQPCDSRPVTPVCDQDPVPEWATAEIPRTEFPLDTASTSVPLLARSDSVLAADTLFLDDTIDTSTVADWPVVYGEEASPQSQLNSRFSFATATPREHPKQWVSSQVVSWVRSRGIPDEVAALFAEHEVEGEDLLCMTRAELREVGVAKMGHLMKLAKGIAELNGTTTVEATVENPVVVTVPLKSQPADTTGTNSIPKDLKDFNRWAALVSTVPLAKAVGSAQLIAEAAEVIKQSDNVPSLNEVLQSAAVANKTAEVVRSDGMPVTLCMLAAKHGRIGCLQRLLCELPAQQTIDTVRVDDGCTALHLAAYGGSGGCVKLLLEAGADTSLVNCYGETPFDCAAKRHADPLAAIFAQHTGNAPGVSSNNDSLNMIGRSATKILHPRRHTKKSRDKLANELSAWRYGGGAASAA